MEYKLYYEIENDAIILVEDGNIIRYDSGVTHGSDFLHYFVDCEEPNAMMLKGLSAEDVISGYKLLEEEMIFTEGESRFKMYLDAVGKLKLEYHENLELLTEFEV